MTHDLKSAALVELGLNINQWRQEFEKRFSLPNNVIWRKRLYAPNGNWSWLTQQYCEKWESWLADRLAMIERLQVAEDAMQPVLFQMRHRVGGQWKNIHLEPENFKAFVEQTPDYEFRKLCVML